MSDAGFLALHRGVAVVDPQRDVVRAWGPDTLTFLQGQLSQDLSGVGDGGSVWSWLLQPAGKVEALVRVSRLDAEEWLLDTDAGWGDKVAARLTRFKLRTKLDLEHMTGWKVVGLRGPDALSSGLPLGRRADERTVAVLDASWPGLPGVDLVGPQPEVPTGAVAVDAGIWQAARIAAGIPVMGAEMGERTIPAETGLIDRTVSFTKGCYTGQELVARIDSRGSNVPRVLRGFRLAAPAEAGATLLGPDGANAGVLTSVAHSPDLGWVALGYVRRGVEIGASLAIEGSVVEGSGVAVVAALPLTGPDAGVAGE